MKLTRNTIANWENDKNKPDLDVLCALCGILHVSLETMLGLDHVPGITREEERLVNTYRSLSPVGKKIAARTLSAMLDEEYQVMNDYLKSSYVLQPRSFSAAAAGPGYGYSDEPPEPVFVQRNDLSTKSDCIIRVNGDSMEPVYHDHDEVYVSFTEPIAAGDDVVCDTADGMVIKRYDKSGVLYSINKSRPFGPHYEDDRVEIKGKVLGIVNPDDYARGNELNTLYELFKDQLREFRQTHATVE